MSLLRKKPWLWIVLAFLILIAAWSVLISIAVKNQPEKIPVGGEAAAEKANPDKRVE